MFYHPRYGVMAKSQRGSSGPEMTGGTVEERSGFKSQKWEQGKFLPLEVESERGGRLQLLPLSLQIIEGVVPVSTERGAAASVGDSDPPPAFR